MNVPETLVQRSAEARAKATGASVDDVLAAWAGGAAAPAAAAPVESAPAPAPAAEATPAPEPTVEPATTPAPVAAAAPAPSAVAVMDLPPAAPIEPVGLRERSRVGGRIGMGFGVLAALFVMLFSAQWLLARSGATETEAGEVSFIFSVVPGSFILGSALVGAAIGATGAAFVRALTGWRAAGMRLVSPHASSLLVGAVAGLVTGVVVAGVIAGSGSADPADETVTLVPMIPAILWTLLGWIGGGWLIGTLVHALGVPDGLGREEMTEGTVVRRRLGSAYSFPVVSVLAILVLVLPAAWVFIQFPAWAPLIAIFIAGGIISFAGLSAARPGMKISAGEFLIAVSGVGVVVIILVAVLTTQGAGH